MFETSQSTAKLDESLAKAQGEIETAQKDKINPAFKSKYADLTAVWAAIRPALSKHGISVTQWPVHSDDSRLHMITRLAHAGEWLKAEFSIPVTKVDAHGYGSAVTYAKRFSLAAAVGVVADIDDDGNAASERTNGVMIASNGTPGASKAPSREPYDKMVKEIRNAKGVKALQDWYAHSFAEIEKLPPDFVDELRIEYTDKLSELKKGLAA